MKVPLELVVQVALWSDCGCLDCAIQSLTRLIIEQPHLTAEILRVLEQLEKDSWSADPRSALEHFKRKAPVPSTPV